MGADEMGGMVLAMVYTRDGWQRESIGSARFVGAIRVHVEEVPKEGEIETTCKTKKGGNGEQLGGRSLNRAQAPNR